jgi:hypothetical protein
MLWMIGFWFVLHKNLLFVLHSDHLMCRTWLRRVDEGQQDCIPPRFWAIQQYWSCVHVEVETCADWSLLHSLLSSKHNPSLANLCLYIFSLSPAGNVAQIGEVVNILDHLHIDSDKCFSILHSHEGSLIFSPLVFSTLGSLFVFLHLLSSMWQQGSVICRLQILEICQESPLYPSGWVNTFLHYPFKMFKIGSDCFFAKSTAFRR